MSEKEARERREELFRLLAEAEDSEALTATLVRRMVARAEAEEPEWGVLLRAAAIPRRLDEGVVGVLRGAPDDADGNRAALERLANYSFVLPDPEGRSYALHEEVRAVLLEDWQAPERRARYVELSRALWEYFARGGFAVRRPPDDTSGESGDWLEALYHRFAFDPAGALTEFEGCFETADVFYRRAECGALLAVAEEQERELDAEQRLWLRYYRARLAWVLDRWPRPRRDIGSFWRSGHPHPRPLSLPRERGGCAPGRCTAWALHCAARENGLRQWRCTGRR